MAAITIGPTNGVTQKYDVAFIAAASLAINTTNFPDLTATKVLAIYAKSGNRQGYVFNKPGGGIPSLQQFTAVASGLPPNVYELNLKAQITLDTAQFYVVGATQGSTDAVLTQLVFTGDSLSTNFGDTASDSYPQVVAKTLTDPAKWQYAGLGGANGNTFGHPGWTTGQLLSVTGEITAVYAANASLHIVGLWAGINDLALSTQPDIAGLRSNVAALIVKYTAANYKVMLFTLTSARGPSYASQHASIDAYRVAHNTWLRQNWQAMGASCLIDPASDYRIGQFDSGLDTTYFSDGIHMNAAGRAIVANMARQGILTVAAGVLNAVICGVPLPSTNGVQAIAPASGYLFVEAEDAAKWTNSGAWESSTTLLPQYYLNGFGKFNSGSPAGATSTTRVQARYIDLFCPSISGTVGSISLIVKRVSDGVQIGVLSFNQAGTDTREGGPNGATPQLTIDGGAFDVYDVTVRNDSGNPASYGAIRISR